MQVLQTSLSLILRHSEMSGILIRIIHYHILCNDLGKVGSIKISLWRMDLALNHQYIHSIKSFSYSFCYNVHSQVFKSQRAYGLLQRANKAQISPDRFFPHVWIPRHANKEGLDYLVSPCFISLQWHHFTSYNYYLQHTKTFAFFFTV